MTKTAYDVVIIGAGPGGYVAAIRAAQLGFEVALVEKRSTLGGTCLNVGCIPSKALLDSSERFAVAAHELADHGIEVSPPRLNLSRMMERKRRVVEELTRGIAMLMKKNGVAVVRGAARLAGGMRVAVAAPEGEEFVLEARRNILLAAGSVPVEIPAAPFDSRIVVSSTEALEFDSVPEHLVVVGGGFIGLELGSVWRRLGARVTVVEMLPALLPMMDDEVATGLTRSLRRQGLEFELGARLDKVHVVGEHAQVEISRSDGSHAVLECDKVLVSVGRRPCTEGLGLQAAGIQLDERGRVAIDDHFRTSAPGISAIGDLVRGPMLAHKAEEEGVAWAELLAGQGGHVNYDAIPGVVYTWPEAAYVGITEREARERYGDAVRVGKFAFAANGRAKAAGEREGFVKVIAGPRGRILGVHIFGPHASELIAEAVTAIEFGATAEDIARTCHAHPTLSEALKEAALAAEGRMIHS